MLLGKLWGGDQKAVVGIGVLTSFVATGMGGEPLGNWGTTPIIMLLLGSLLNLNHSKPLMSRCHDFQQQGIQEQGTDHYTLSSIADKMQSQLGKILISFDGRCLYSILLHVYPDRVI